MARATKLKVYRIPIGFHDAYVAAPSQKAALAAWGADRDLFARGIAELVTDPDLTAEPLARPGEVVKRSRGSAAEQIAALPPAAPPRKRAVGAESKERDATRPPAVAAAPAPPRPDRAALGAAEQALEQALAGQRSDERALKAEEDALRRRRKEMEAEHAEARARLEAIRDEAARRYDAAMRLWRG